MMLKPILRLSSALLLSLFFYSCQGAQQTNKLLMQQNSNTTTDTATFAAGCFWCVEAVFQQLNGVLSVTSGYTGGNTSNPSYREVCSGLTGHAEACRIVFDTAIISYSELLAAFWASHDPTSLNQQGADKGTQYRSAVFYHNKKQKSDAEKLKQQLNAEGIFEQPIVTEITKATYFYQAEDYHQEYYNNNNNAPYCTFVISPKLEQFRKKFAHKLK